MKHVSSHRWLLTGATGGIGQAIAKALTNTGHTLLLSGRDESGLQALLQSLHAGLDSTCHEIVVADLTTTVGLATLKQAAEAFQVNGIINCLGVNSLSTLSGMNETAIANMINTNLVAPIQVCRTLLPLLLQQESPIIVNVGSILGSIGYPGSTVYCASKFGLRGFTESLRRELTDTRIRVVYFAPRATNTELNSPAMTQLNSELGNKTDSPEWVADQLLKALQKTTKASWYLGWPERLFVRLNSLFPSIVDKAILKQLAVIKHFCVQGVGVKSVRKGEAI